MAFSIVPGWPPCGKVPDCKCKTDNERGSTKKKHNKFLLSPGRGQIINFCGYCRIRIPFTVPELLIQGEIRYTFAATSDYECLADDWICVSAFNLFPYLHYVLS